MEGLALPLSSMLGSAIPLRTDSAMVDSLSGGLMTVAESSLLTQPYTIVTGDAVGQWVADRACDGRFYAPLSSCMGLMRGERLVAGAIFDHYNHRSIHLHMAIERLTPTFLSALAHYAFDVAGVETVIAPVTAVNRRSRRAVEHAGFTLEATLKNIHPTGDVLYYTLHRDACPFSTSAYTSRLESYYGR